MFFAGVCEVQLRICVEQHVIAILFDKVHYVLPCDSEKIMRLSNIKCHGSGQVKFLYFVGYQGFCIFKT